MCNHTNLGNILLKKHKAVDFISLVQLLYPTGELNYRLSNQNNKWHEVDLQGQDLASVGVQNIKTHIDLI